MFSLHFWLSMCLYDLFHFKNINEKFPYHAPISALHAMKSVHFTPKSILLGQRFSKCCCGQNNAVFSVHFANWITRSPIEIKSRNNALILMNLMNERGHMTTDFLEWPIFTSLTMPGVCVIALMLYTVRERPKQ